MFTPSLLLQPHSGLVPFSGAAEPAPSDQQASSVSADEAPWARCAPPRIAAWEAPAGAGVRRVEMVIIACVCINFTLGLGRMLGLY